MTTPSSLTATPTLFTRHPFALAGRDTEAQGCGHPAHLAPLIFLSVSVSFWEAEVVRVPKMCFRPIRKKEVSIFTAETAFLLTGAFLGQVF